MDSFRGWDEHIETGKDREMYNKFGNSGDMLYFRPLR